MKRPGAVWIVEPRQAVALRSVLRDTSIPSMQRPGSDRTVHYWLRHAWATSVALVLVAAGCGAPPPGAVTLAPVPANADVPPLALMVPVEGVAPSRVPDTFNAMRGGRAHRAIDILAPRGTPVVAVAGGEVYRIRQSGPGGLAVYATDSTHRWMFYYAHLDSFRDGLAEGMKLAQGDVIGFVGTTGNAPPDTPHLHFQLMHARFDTRWWDGEALDPRAYFVRTGEPR